MAADSCLTERIYENDPDTPSTCARTDSDEGWCSASPRTPEKSLTSPGSFDVEQNAVYDSNPFPGWGLDGMTLHKNLAPDIWCISRADLIFFNESIKTALRDGNITPTHLDPFDPKDELHGPNMYTVVDQYIKPLTKAAGGMSWALARNPKGLGPCGIFITHAWVEGAFGFIRKVLESWRGFGDVPVWCCIFANPQNLDIGSLIGNPRNSPFAKAMQAAPVVMVVANSKYSIYTRIWCVYEAYLAMEWGKVVVSAVAPSETSEIAIKVCKVCLAALAIMYLAKRAVKNPDAKMALQVVLILIWVSFGIAAFTGVVARATSCAESGRIRQQCNSLRKDFKGVLLAQSSNPKDKIKILADIGTDAQKVDTLIDVFLRVGLYSPLIQKIAENEGLGVALYAWPWTGTLLCILGSAPLELKLRSDRDWRLLGAAGFTMTCFIIRFCISDAVGKAFLHSALLKTGILLIILRSTDIFTAATCASSGVEYVRCTSNWVVLTRLSVLAVSTIVACCGWERCRRIPLIGTIISRFFGPGVFGPGVVSIKIEQCHNRCLS